jgi:hypothetical protein
VGTSTDDDDDDDDDSNTYTYRSIAWPKVSFRAIQVTLTR